MPIEKQFIKIYTDKKSRHSVLQHRLVDESGADYQQILAVTKAYAKEGECKINPIVVPKAEKGRKKNLSGHRKQLQPGFDYGKIRLCGREVSASQEQ